MNYGVGNQITYYTEVLKPNLCDNNDAYILVRGDIFIASCNIVTEVVFKNCAPLTKCITKIDGTAIDDTENLDLVMSMYNLIEYIKNYSETTGSYGFIQKMKYLVLMQIFKTVIILNLSNMMLNY